MRIRDLFLPTETNDYKPWIITPEAMAVFCIVIWGLKFFLPTAVVFGQNTIDATDLMSKINLERTQRFLPSLTTNSKLITAANSKANDMLARSYFSHVDPDGSYVWPRIESAGYTPYSKLGENLAMDFSSASAVVSAWMNSPTHRENIIDPKFEDQGLASVAGLYETNHDTIMVVSLFGTLFKTAKATPPPSPSPTPTPNPKPVPAPAPAPTSKTQASSLAISKDIKVNQTALSGHTLINLNVIVLGSPSLVTAKLKSQSITLLKGKTTGEYLGSFTFDPNEDLTNQTLTVEARNQAGTKTAQEFPVNFPNQGVTGNTALNELPISTEEQVIKILRIIFGIFATIYVAFLAIDAIIIHRMRLKRPSIHTGTHALVFLLIALVSIFANWF